jgi:hypothetical protein
MKRHKNQIIRESRWRVLDKKIESRMNTEENITKIGNW